MFACVRVRVCVCVCVIAVRCLEFVIRWSSLELLISLLIKEGPIPFSDLNKQSTCSLKMRTFWQIGRYYKWVLRWGEVEGKNSLIILF